MYNFDMVERIDYESDLPVDGLEIYFLTTKWLKKAIKTERKFHLAERLGIEDLTFMKAMEVFIAEKLLLDDWYYSKKIIEFPALAVGFFRYLSCRISQEADAKLIGPFAGLRKFLEENGLQPLFLAVNDLFSQVNSQQADNNYPRFNPGETLLGKWSERWREKISGIPPPSPFLTSFLNE